MDWFTAFVLYALIWWTVLFGVLPLGVRPAEQADHSTGWRGAPQEVRLVRKLLLTTLVSAMFWAGAVWLIKSDWLSFRHGILGMPSTYS